MYMLIRRGVRLGIDVGKVRVGVCRSDIDGILATPLETLSRAADGSDYKKIAIYVDDLNVLEIVVGYPLSLSAKHTQSTQDVDEFAVQLSTYVDVPIRFVDERLSTVTAQRQLKSLGKKTKQTRHIIDQAAAVVLLQYTLDHERLTEKAPGYLLDKNYE